MKNKLALSFPVLLPFLVLPAAIAGGSGKHTGKTIGKSSAAPQGWQWNVKAGTAYRHFRGVDFRTPVYWITPGGGMSWPFPHLADIGIDTVFADRQYQNGFVFMDDATANPESFLPGTTAYWSYDSAAQVQGGELVFDTGEYVRSSAEVIPGPGDSPDNDGHQTLEAFAPVLEIEALYSITDELRRRTLFDIDPANGNRRATIRRPRGILARGVRLSRIEMKVERAFLVVA